MGETIRELKREVQRDDCSREAYKQYYMALEAKIAWMEQEAHAAADEIERLREALRRVAFNAHKREMVLGEAREKFIAMMEANNNAALWQCLWFVGKIAMDALGEGK